MICTGSMSSLTPSALMIHEIDPTVKIWLDYGRDEEPTKHTILFNMETAHTPLPVRLRSHLQVDAVEHRLDSGNYGIELAPRCSGNLL